MKKFCAHRVPIVYLDKAVFTINTKRKKAWFSKHENLKVDQESRHMEPIALIAAIEEERGLVAYAIHNRSINSENFVAFLDQLKEHMSSPEFGLYLDNLSVHKTKKVKQKLEELKIHPIFIIPYSPDFNGIESFFSLVKAEYKALLLNKLMEEEEIDAADLITKSLSKID